MRAYVMVYFEAFYTLQAFIHSNTRLWSVFLQSLRAWLPSSILGTALGNPESRVAKRQL